MKNPRLKKIFFLLFIFFSSQLFCGDHCLVFVHIGNQLPKHIEHSIKQARLFNPNTDIFLLSNNQAFSNIDLENLKINNVDINSLQMSENHKKYDIKAKATGFWRYTLERFLVLDDFIQEYNLENVFHIENDVMLYFNLSDFLPLFKEYYSNTIATVFDCDQRSVPCFVYISNQKETQKLAKFIAERAHLDTTDMETLSLFKNANYGIKGHLPYLIPSYAEDYPLLNIFKQFSEDARPFYNHLNDLKMIFDANALGQFLGGIDPILAESKPGFLNEASIFLTMHFQFNWVQDNQKRWIPYISYKGTAYPIATLHIHSKALEKFSSTNNEMPAPPSYFHSTLPFDHIKAKIK